MRRVCTTKKLVNKGEGEAVRPHKNEPIANLLGEKVVFTLGRLDADVVAK